MAGSIWAETVLSDQGLSLRRSGHPTCLYSEEKFWGPHRATELKELDQTGPFWAFGRYKKAPHLVKVCDNHESNWQ